MKINKSFLICLMLTILIIFKIPFESSAIFSPLRLTYNNTKDRLFYQNIGSKYEYCMILDKLIYINERDKNIGDKSLDNQTTNTFKNYRYPDPNKVAYLTFDDGPSKSVTPKILDILKDRDIKATFFTIGKSMESYPEITQRILREGHSLGNHSYSHDYNSIYAGVENFENEINTWNNTIENISNENCDIKIFRFPGGSHNKDKKYKEHVEAMGYKYYDWNSLNGDAESVVVSRDYLIKRTKETVNGQKELIFLMHDAKGKDNTASVLPEIIHYLKTKGYEFKTL